MNEDGEMVFGTGDPLEAYVVSTDEEIILSRFLRKDQRQADMLYRAFKSGMPVEGKVTAVNKWGLGVEISGNAGVLSEIPDRHAAGEGPSRNTADRRCSSGSSATATTDATSCCRAAPCCRPKSTRRPPRSASRS